MTRRLGLGLVMMVLVAGLGVGQWLRVSEVEVPIGLAAPVRMAVISDIHLGAHGSGAKRAERTVAEAMAQRPDTIVLLGDFVSSKAGIVQIAQVLRGIQAPLGVYAVLGNHDHWADARGIRAALEGAGVRVLTNESVVLRRGRARLALVGIDDLWAGRVNWRAAWRRVPKGTPAVLLSHNPDAALHSEGQRAALILSGHTHAGTIWLPQPVYPALKRLTGVGLISASKYGETHLYGLFRERWGCIYITSGVNLGNRPPRWFTRPEVAVVEVR